RVLRPLCLACHHISPCFSLTSARDSFCGGKLKTTYSADNFIAGYLLEEARFFTIARESLVDMNFRS
ncbi:hypothetical protein ACUXQ2_006551, partial [Cupriavidus metallidurans]